MAEKRSPGFNIPLNFYDGAEVQSIPKRIRAAAIGVWALAGDYAATQLTDGYVPSGMLKTFGCTEAIRAALKVTINKRGELSPLWIDANLGGVQLTNWPKHQRTNDEVTNYRAGEAERKRLEREAKRAAAARANAETSGRTTAGQSTAVRPDGRDPKTETETKTGNSCSYVGTEPTDGATHGISATPGADLVRAIVPNGHPPATLTSLRLQASELLNTGTDENTVRIALQLWCDKPGVGIGRTILASLCSEAIKSRTTPSGNVHQITAFDRKKAANAAVFQALATEPTHLEIEP